MSTARDIIKRSLQKVGVLVKQESPSADETNDALDSLNDMLSSWSNDSLLLFARTWESFTLTAGDGEYTIGTGGDFNTTRPLFIADAYTRLSNSDYPVKVITDEVYSTICVKDTRGRPEVLNFDNAVTLPKIRLWPAPDTNYTLYLQTEKELSALALDTVITLPAGWKRALIYNLALELAPEYGQEVPEIVQRNAVQSKGLIMKAINKIRILDSAPADGYFNIYTGGF